jgi:hypothetical protein
MNRKRNLYNELLDSISENPFTQNFYTKDSKVWKMKNDCIVTDIYIYKSFQQNKRHFSHNFLTTEYIIKI